MTKKSNLIFFRIIGIICVILGLAMSFFSGIMVSEESKLIPASSINHKYMESAEYYSFEELTVIDCYGTSTYDGTFPDEWHYIVSFEDVDGHTYYASMTVEDKDDAFNELREYAENEEAYIGDCVINAVVEYASPFQDSFLDQEMIGYYKDAVAKYSDADADVIDSGYSFDYSCAPEAFESYADEEMAVYKRILYAGVVIFVLGVVFVFLGFRKSLKDAKREEEDELLRYGQGQNQYQYQETYYTPPINQTPPNE